MYRDKFDLIRSYLQLLRRLPVYCEPSLQDLHLKSSWANRTGFVMAVGIPVPVSLPNLLCCLALPRAIEGFISIFGILNGASLLMHVPLRFEHVQTGVEEGVLRPISLLTHDSVLQQSSPVAVGNWGSCVYGTRLRKCILDVRVRVRVGETTKTD